MLIGQARALLGQGDAAASPDDGGMAPSQLHRGMALLADISLFIGTRSSWTDALTSRPAVMAALSACYLGILAWRRSR